MLESLILFTLNVVLMVFFFFLKWRKKRCWLIHAKLLINQKQWRNTLSFPSPHKFQLRFVFYRFALFLTNRFRLWRNPTTKKIVLKIFWVPKHYFITNKYSRSRLMWSLWARPKVITLTSCFYLVSISKWYYEKWSR